MAKGEHTALVLSVRGNTKRCDIGSSGSKKMVRGFSGHFDWNGKRGIRLRIFIFFGNFPVESAVPLEFPTGIFGFC